ncbi:hypothetical protein BE21_53895 [Sorangium cellulosum]|uniref:Uncharacterized protein n=1 Tax=Sorangium cellulosum TaxID=56 RepID=A0A150TEF2_SORCE|nr:hypothetical protein BE21_53895 [Sorangium cellulosum]
MIYTMRCLNEFLTKLKNTPHGSSNLLDSSLVFVTSDSLDPADEVEALLTRCAGPRPELGL